MITNGRHVVYHREEEESAHYLYPGGEKWVHLATKESTKRVLHEGQVVVDCGSTSMDATMLAVK